ncbi:IclR family transcriptional regulator [Rhodococcus opacus]|uniref:IclR family transcriptional regulator n=1 Tax=Rhodococcus opacus TaxID=37919 RepID=UPI001FF621ED|nr:IclR family transcriptional regulator [Rhodococcus opacus]UOT03235.1 IclR family transcriptional regulator [Rhodococcus opacus]
MSDCVGADTAESSGPAEFVNKSVTKAVRLLRELAAQPRTGANVTTLAKAVGISRPTAFRLLYSLERTGLVDRVDNNYILGWETARLGRLANPYTGLAIRAQPLLDELAAKFNESVSLSVPNSRDGLDLIAEATGSHVVGIMSRMSHDMVGQQYPLHASSSGKVLLAEWPVEKVLALLPEKLKAFTAHTITNRAALIRELEQVSEQGFSVIDNELEEELLSLSRPIRDSSGNLVAVLSLNGPRYRLGRDRIPEAAKQMRHTADRLIDVLWQDTATE